MISKIKLNSKYLEGPEQVVQDHLMRNEPRYIEVRTGYVCDPTFHGGLYCRYTGRNRNKVRQNQYLRLSLDDYNKISRGRWATLDYDTYKHLLNDSTSLHLPVT